MKKVISSVLGMRSSILIASVCGVLMLSVGCMGSYVKYVTPDGTEVVYKRNGKQKIDGFSFEKTGDELKVHFEGQEGEEEKLLKTIQLFDSILKLNPKLCGE